LGLSLAAAYAGALLGRGSVSSHFKKRLRALEQTTADLELNFDSLLDSHKRLRSRAGMRELRAREEPVSKHETKAEIRARIFGNKSGPAFARQQLESK
jgi:hypothetical protein